MAPGPPLSKVSLKPYFDSTDIQVAINFAIDYAVTSGYPPTYWALLDSPEEYSSSCCAKYLTDPKIYKLIPYARRCNFEHISNLVTFDYKPTNNTSTITKNLWDVPIIGPNSTFSFTLAYLLHMQYSVTIIGTTFKTRPMNYYNTVKPLNESELYQRQKVYDLSRFSVDYWKSYAESKNLTIEIVKE